VKCRLGTCNAPNCTHLHDLDGKGTASFVGWTQPENHILLSGSDQPGSSLHSGADCRESRDLGDDSEANSEVDSDENDEDAPPDSSNCRDDQPETRGYQALAQQLHQQFKDCNDDALAACLPRDFAGQPTTIGSTLHESNRCRPCRHKMSSQPCADGLRCLYCHMDHTLCAMVAQQQVADGGVSKARPRKGARDRYRKHVSRITEQIMADPFSWSVNTMYIPRFIDGNPELKRKFMARMALIAEHARTQVAHAASSSGATGTIILPQGSGNIGLGITAQDLIASATVADVGGQHGSSATEAIQPRKLISL